ncbi:MAG: hypothetical protein JNM84_22005, partial [Planctomycetes bacterium]|nr:hypothetical protein [Planctomycetota bacterium]
MQSHRFLSAALCAALGAGTASAQFHLSEILVDLPGTDNGQEAIELRGAPNASLAGWGLLMIDGDTTASGTIDQALDLGAFSTGANGLFLWRDAATVLLPAPDAATALHVADINPDIENGTITFLLGFGTLPAVNTDFDAGNDGTLDGPIPGFTVVDAVSYTDGGTSDSVYADEFPGGFVFPRSNFTPDTIFRYEDELGQPLCWGAGDVLGTTPGPYDYDFALGEVYGGTSLGFGPQAASPGNANARLSLCSDSQGFTLVLGGTQNLLLDAGAAQAGRTYFVLGSVSGTTPGLPFGAFTLPLAFDPYFEFTLVVPNAPTLFPSLGTLDGNGRANVAFAVPPGAVFLPATIVA